MELRKNCEKKPRKKREETAKKLRTTLAMPQKLFRAIISGMDDAAKCVAEVHSLTFSWSGDKMVISAENDKDMEVANEMKQWIADELFLSLIDERHTLG